MQSETVSTSGPHVGSHHGRNAACLRLVLHPLGQQRLGPLVSCLGQSVHPNIVTPRGSRRQQEKVALTLMTFFCQDHSSDPPLVRTHSAHCCCCFSTSITTPLAFGEPESIPAVPKRRWGCTGSVPCFSSAHTERQPIALLLRIV